VTAVPEGYVDPRDSSAVAAVLAATWSATGVDGLADLLSRMQGSRFAPGRPRRLLSPAVPASVWLGPEDELVLTEPPEHRHVVGGVVLQRTALPPADLAPTLARLITSLTRSQDSYADTAAVLTAARDVTGA
jgi:hypothetical protein